MGTPLALGILVAWGAARVVIRAHTGVGLYEGWKLCFVPLDLALAFTSVEALPDPAAARCIVVVAIGLAVPWRPAGRVPPSIVGVTAVMALALTGDGEGTGRVARAGLQVVAWGVARAGVRRAARLEEERDRARELADEARSAGLARARRTRAESSPVPAESAVVVELDLPTVLRASRVRAAERLARERGSARGPVRHPELIVHASTPGDQPPPRVDAAVLGAAFEHLFRRALEHCSGERVLKVLIRGNEAGTRVRFIHDLAHARLRDADALRCGSCGATATEVLGRRLQACAACAEGAVLADLAAFAGTGEGPLGALVARAGVRVETGSQSAETREVYVELAFSA